MPTRLRSAILLALVGTASALPAQVRLTRPVPERDDVRRLARTLISGIDDDTGRPRLGIAVELRGTSDTLGILVGEVTPGGPADQAGVKAGDRLLHINAVNLQLDSADAADPDVQGVAIRRLTRELARHANGDPVQLRLMRDGRPLTVHVTTAARSDVQPTTRLMRSARADADRASLGVALASTWSARDTLGVFITSVSPGGPADKAGVQEGDRIASINGVDLRVPRDDAEDWAVSSARVRRLGRELEQVTAGGDVSLRVLRAGQSRTVTVKTVAARELTRGPDARMFRFGGAIPMFDFSPRIVPPIPPIPPIPSIPSIPPVPPVPPVPPSPPGPSTSPSSGAIESLSAPASPPLPPSAPRAPVAPRWYRFDDDAHAPISMRRTAPRWVERVSDPRM